MGKFAGEEAGWINHNRSARSFCYNEIIENLLHNAGFFCTLCGCELHRDEG